MNAREIERLVDQEIGARPEAILNFLFAIERAAMATSDHLQSNWQDRAAAKAWEKIARKVSITHDQVRSSLPF